MRCPRAMCGASTRGREAALAARSERTGTSTSSVVRATEHLLALDATQGASAALPAVRAVVRGVPELSGDPARLRGLDRELLAALAELSEVVGWILFDAGRYAGARRANARALAVAGLCGDTWTARLTLLNHSMLQARTGHARAALESASRVAAGPGPLPARVGALVLIRTAHAVALFGGDREPVELISRARSRFLDGVSRRDPAWSWWIDETELLGHQGWVHARTRRWDPAIDLLRQAVAVPGPAYRDLFTAELLGALVGAGAWRDAEELIARLAPRAARIGSVRTTETLTETAVRLRGRTGVPTALRDAAVHLLEQLPERAAGPLTAPEPPPAARP
ncbi:Putative C1 regulatory protein [Streptomyces formicae]|uniref:C1 regulatory protein n=1 Tax=Streptomyces formicae TaxID=1616117 RepID=A0A291Q1U8_9ACTN|nr:Putative C1 regulatory protein [Streptomyces formicae]